MCLPRPKPKTKKAIRPFRACFEIVALLKLNIDATSLKFGQTASSYHYTLTP